MTGAARKRATGPRAIAIMAKKKKFYKKEKSKEAVKELPSNSRSIPEKIMSDHLVFFVGLACIILATVMVSLSLYSNYQVKQQLSGERSRIQKELDFWEKQTAEKPSFRDAYFSLAILYYQLKDFKKSSENLEKAMEIDPNFEKGRELQVILENN